MSVAAAPGVELIRYSVPVKKSRRWPDSLEKLCEFRCKSEKQTEAYDQLQKYLERNIDNIYIRETHSFATDRTFTMLCVLIDYCAEGVKTRWNDRV